MQTYRISFPSVHGPGRGVDFLAETKADSEAHATRDVLEACAARGVTLDHVVIANVSDLKGAVLDGLKLSGCTLRNVNLQGVSLRGSRIVGTTFDHVHADHTTHLDGSSLEVVRFVDCSLNGLVATGMNAGSLHFERTHATGLDVTNAHVLGLRNVCSSSTLARWKHGGAVIQSGSFDPHALYAA